MIFEIEITAVDSVVVEGERGKTPFPQMMSGHGETVTQ